MAKKDVATKKKVKAPKLSSWEREYGDRLESTVKRASSKGPVYFDVEKKAWLPGEGPAVQVKRSGKGGKRAAMKKGQANQPARREARRKMNTPPSRPKP